MSQFTENDSSLMSQVHWETFCIDLQLHTEGLPSHKWESLVYYGWTPILLLTDWNKTYRPNVLGCNCANNLQSANQLCGCNSGLMRLFYTHIQQGHWFQKPIVKHVEMVPQLVWHNGGQKLRARLAVPGWYHMWYLISRLVNHVYFNPLHKVNSANLTKCIPI